MANAFDGSPDRRQLGSQSEAPDGVALASQAHPFLRFRARYRALTDAELLQHDAIKDKAEELAALFDGLPPGRDRSLAYTHLEDAVMRAVRALTA